MKKGILLFVIIAVVFAIYAFKQRNPTHTLVKGQSVVPFTLKDQNDSLFTISDFIGKKNLVIYFYPKDDTPGCTKEACKFRDEFEIFTELDAIVIGISADSPESHQKFAKKYNLPFTLLSDPENQVRNSFGVKPEFLGIIPGRVTFIVDRTGTIQYVFNSLSKAEQHVEEAKKILISLK